MYKCCEKYRTGLAMFLQLSNNFCSLIQGFTPPMLVFVQSIERAKALFQELIYDGMNVDVIHSERTQAQRDNVVKSFRSGKVQICVSCFIRVNLCVFVWVHACICFYRFNKYCCFSFFRYGF